MPGRRGCSVTRGAPRGLSKFLPVSSNKTPFGLSPVGLEKQSCDDFINILWPKYIFLVQVCRAPLSSKIDNTHIDRTCDTEHRSTRVGFDICSYRGYWFYIPFYLEGIAPLFTVSYGTYKEYAYGISHSIFGEIKNERFFKNELFLNDPEGVNWRSARPSASYTYWVCSNKRACS